VRGRGVVIEQRDHQGKSPGENPKITSGRWKPDNKEASTKRGTRQSQKKTALVLERKLLLGPPVGTRQITGNAIPKTKRTSKGEQKKLKLPSGSKGRRIKKSWGRDKGETTSPWQGSSQKKFRGKKRGGKGGQKHNSKPAGKRARGKFIRTRKKHR